MPTTILPIGEALSSKLHFQDGTLFFATGRYGATIHIIGPGIDVEARVHEEIVSFGGESTLLPISAWIGTVRVRGHSHRVVSMNIWDERDAVAQATAAELLSLVKAWLIRKAAA